MGENTQQAGVGGLATFAVGVIVGMGIAIFGVFGLLHLMVERFPTMSSPDHIERTTAYAGALYVEVGFADRTLMWIRSTDRGAHWTKVADPAEEILAEPLDGADCAADGVCYLAQFLNDEDKTAPDPSIVQIRRLTDNGRWRAEARFDRWAECDAEKLAVDVSNSDRAMTECTVSTVAGRTRAGHWPVQDVLEIARGLR